MKTILKLSLAIFAVMTAMGAHAINGDFLVNVKKGSGRQISFSVNDIQMAKLTIYDRSHNVVYSEKASGINGIEKTYSLEEFPQGVYFLEVETNLKKVTHEIVVSNEASTLSRRPMAEVYKGSLKIKNENVAAAN